MNHLQPRWLSEIAQGAPLAAIFALLCDGLLGAAISHGAPRAEVVQLPKVVIEGRRALEPVALKAPISRNFN